MTDAEVLSLAVTAPSLRLDLPSTGHVTLDREIAVT